MEYKIIVNEPKIETDKYGKRHYVIDSVKGEIERFEKRINEMVRQGWKPLGRCQSNFGQGDVYQIMQTMIRE